MSGTQIQHTPTPTAKEDLIDVNEFLQNLPEHLSLLTSQAGGHPFNQEKKTLGLLKHKDGYVLKPTQSKKSIDELNFYRKIQRGHYAKLAPLVPKFNGTVKVPFRNSSLDFIVLEDLARNFKAPCVLDLKIGKRTWGPDAKNEKINHEMGKYTKSKECYGFCIPGYQIIDPVTNEVMKFGREYCRALDPEGVVKEIERFVSTTKNDEATAALLKRIIFHLEPILEWASVQTELRIYASSVIIVYDSQILLDSIPFIHTDNTPANHMDFVRVKMVDFCHVHPAPEDEGIDTNYLQGLNSVLNIFQALLLKYSTSA